MATYSSTLAWRVPWTEGPDGLQCMGSLRVGDDWATSLSLFTFTRWRRKWQPTPVFLPGESQGWGAWWAAVYEVAQSRTRLKRFSSSSSLKFECVSYPSHIANKELLKRLPYILLHSHSFSICQVKIINICDWIITKNNWQIHQLIIPLYSYRLNDAVD